MKTYKALAILMSYPEKEWILESDAILDAISKEKLLPKKNIAALKELVDFLSEGDIYDVKEHYSNLFDNGKAHCLNLFEHVYGESRDRGQAMVELIEHYKAIGLDCSAKELPDYLPMYLEYLSELSPNDAIINLNNVIYVVAVIAARLKKQNTPYNAIFDALHHLSNERLDMREVKKAAEAVPFKQDLEELDQDWEEAHAFDNSNLTGNSQPANPIVGDGIGVAVPQPPKHTKAGEIA